MKKLIALLLTFSIIFCLSACAKTTGSEGSDSIKVDEGLANVTVTLPASFLDENDTEESLKAAAEENGFKSCTVNADGSVTYVMSKKTRNEFLKEMKSDLDESIADIVNDSESSFDKIDYNKDLTKFTLYANEKYNDWDAFTILGFYIVGAYYQIFDGVSEDDIDIIITLKDSSTNEVKDEFSYKEWVKNSSEG